MPRWNRACTWRSPFQWRKLYPSRMCGSEERVRSFRHVGCGVGVVLCIKSSIKPVSKWFAVGSALFFLKPPNMLFRKTSTLLPKTIYLFAKPFGMLPLTLENTLSLVTLMLPPLTGQITHVPNLMYSIKTFSPLRRKYFFICLSTRFRMGNPPSVLGLVFTKFVDTASAISLLATLRNSYHATAPFV